MIYITATVTLSNDSMEAWEQANSQLLTASEGFTPDGAGTGFGQRDMDWSFPNQDSDKAMTLYDRLVAELSEECVTMDGDDE